MCKLQSLCVCYDLCMYAMITMCMLWSLQVCFDLHEYTMISMCMLRSQGVCFDLVYDMISMCVFYDIYVCVLIWVPLCVCSYVCVLVCVFLCVCSMCVFLCVCFYLCVLWYLWVFLCVFSVISMCVFYDLYVYAIIFSCMIRSVCVCYVTMYMLRSLDECNYQYVYATICMHMQKMLNDIERSWSKLVSTRRSSVLIWSLFSMIWTHLLPQCRFPSKCSRRSTWTWPRASGTSWRCWPPSTPTSSSSPWPSSASRPGQLPTIRWQCYKTFLSVIYYFLK